MTTGSSEIGRSAGGSRLRLRLPPDIDRLLLAIGVLVTIFGPGAAGGVSGDLAVVVFASVILAWALALVAVFVLVRGSDWAIRIVPPLAAAFLPIAVFEAASGDVAIGAIHAIGGSLALSGGLLLLRGPSPTRLPLPDRFVSTAPPLPDDPRATPVPDSDVDPVLEAFMEEAARLNREEERRLATLWQSADGQARRLAWRAVGRLVSGRGRQPPNGRGRRLDDVRTRVAELGLTAEGSVWTWVFGSMQDVDRGDLRRATVPALLDTAAALILRDRLDGADFDALYGPWRRLHDGVVPVRRLGRGRRRARGASEPRPPELPGGGSGSPPG